MNTDPGVRPGREKGACVHVDAMRDAFRACGADVVALDLFDEQSVHERLEAEHASTPIDLIYERFALHSRAAGRFASRHGVAYVLEINAPLDEEEARHRPGGLEVDLAALRAHLDAASELLCVSEDVAAWARTRGGPHARVRVVGNGVDTDRFRPELRARGMSALSLPDDAFVVGFHGRLRPWHGFGRLVDSLAILRAQKVPVHLLAIGVGDFEAEIGDALPRDAWTCLPWVPNEKVGEYVACFDVLPLTYDPAEPCYFSPLKLLEAMAAGVVPLVPQLGDLARTVGNGSAGMIYDPHDMHSFVVSISRLHRDPELRNELRENARALASGHSWKSIATDVLEQVGEAAR
ncbi:MAG: glycosyltransferase involved in cell wall biosynthesis [Planctomycetota bacterium]|jgi:glycosyltransferase involved in cell wall biosynthesis